MTRDQMLAHLRAAGGSRARPRRMGIILSAVCCSAPTIASSCGRGTSTSCAMRRPSSAGARRRPIPPAGGWTSDAGHHLRALRHVRRHALLGDIGALVDGLEETQILR